ncbi:hypothetical protein O6V33_16620 [Salmonella enterica subsp. enterica]
MKRLLFLLMMMQFTQLGYAACNATLTNTKDYTIQSDSLMLGGGGGGGGEESAIITNGFTDANCSNSDVVTKLETSDHIIGMGPNDSVKLKLKVEWQSSSAINMRNQNGVIEAPYKITISEINSLEAVTVSARGGTRLR